MSATESPRQTRYQAFADNWEKSIKLGYSPVSVQPLRLLGDPKNKAPIEPKWDVYRKRVVTREEAEHVIKNYPNAQLGFAAGYGGLMIVDIDIENDSVLQQQIVDALPHTEIRRIGNRKRVGAILYRWIGNGPPPSFKLWHRDGRKLGEFISRVHIMMPPSIHETGVPYEMVRVDEDGCCTPCDVPALDELPTFNEADKSAFIMRLFDILKQPQDSEHGFPDFCIPEHIDDAVSIELAKAYISKQPGVPDGFRHDKLVRMVRRCGDFGLTPDRAIELIYTDGWHTRCSPSMAVSELLGNFSCGVDTSRQTAYGSARREYQEPYLIKSGWLQLDENVDRETLAQQKLAEVRARISAPKDDTPKEAPKEETAEPFTPHKEQTKFQLESAAEAVAKFKASEEKWLIEDIIPAVGVGQLFGKSKAYKSFAALDMGLHIALGIPWAGKKVQQAPVVYIAAEASVGVRKRIAGFFAAHPEYDLATCPFYLIAAAPNLGGKETDYGHLVISIEMQCVKPGTITIDTLAQTMHDGDENGAGMQTFISNAQKLSNKFNCFVYAVHHTGLSDDTRSRGFSGLFNALDTSIKCERNGDKRSAVTVDKMKDDEDSIAIEIELKRIPLGIMESGKVISTLVLSNRNIAGGKTENEKHAKEEMDFNSVVLLAVAKGGGSFIKKDIMEMIGLSKNNHQKLTNALKALMTAARGKGERPLVKTNAVGTYVLTEEGEQRAQSIRNRYPESAWTKQGNA